MKIREILIAGRPSAEAKAEIESLKKAGWKLAADNKLLRLSLPLDDEGKEELAEKAKEAVFSLTDMGLELSLCEDEDCADKVRALWTSLLRPTDIPEDHLEFLDNPAVKVFCIKDASGEPVSASWLKISGKSAEKRHIVTKKEYHNRGLATILEKINIGEASAAGALSINTWISSENSISLRLHEKLGYRLTGGSSLQYILPED